MRSTAAAGARERAPLSRERVLGAAIDLADTHGLGALTMRRLAQELGVEAMSLYYYVSGKDDLLSGMVDQVMLQIVMPDDSADWKAALRQEALSEYDVLTRHPWAAGLTLSNRSVSEPRLERMNWILGTLRDAGFSAEQTDLAYHALESHIMGFTLWEVSMDLGSPDDLRRLASGFLQNVSTERFPWLIEHVHQHLKPRDPDAEGAFAFGLDLILDGLERMRQPA